MDFLVSLIGIFIALTGGDALGEPLLAMHLLWINLITDSLPAFALGMEEPDDDVMTDKPRGKKESFFAGKLGVNIAIEGVIIGVVTLTAYFIGHFCLGDDLAGHTMAFMTLATAELFHAYNVKSDHTIFSKSTFNNKFLNYAFIIGMILQFAVLYIPGLNNVFQLMPLNWWELLIVFGLSASIIVFMEIYKLIKRYINNR